MAESHSVQFSEHKDNKIMATKRRSRQADPAENEGTVEVEIKEAEDADVPSDDEDSGQMSQDGFVVHNGTTKTIRTGIVYDERVLKHINAKPGSPETAERVQVCFEKLKRTKLLDQCELIAGEEATDQILTLAHKPEYVRKVRAKCSKLSGRETVEIDQDVVLSRESDTAARVAVGGLVKLTDKVLKGELDNGFAIVRPPGHHAEAGEAMGYCIYNNIAVAARYAISKGIKRVLIVDWDLHHGNGIQNIFLNDDKVMYFSVHYHGRGDYYPGESGALHVVGNDDGYGYNVNVPFNRQKMDTQDYAAVFHKLLLPMALEYGPELIFVAAGFDATRGDKMGIMRVSTAGYGYFTQLLKLINKRIIMSLEGGYNSKLTAMCVEKCVNVLLGQQVSATTPWTPSPQCLETIKNVALTHIKTGWKCFGDYAGMSDNPNTQKRGWEPMPVDADGNEYLVDKVLDDKVVKGRKKYYVSWFGFPADENEWVDEKDISEGLVKDYEAGKKDKKETRKDSSKEPPKKKQKTRR